MRLATPHRLCQSSELNVPYPVRSPSTVDGVIEEERMCFLRRSIGPRRRIRKESDTVGVEVGKRIQDVGVATSSDTVESL